MSTITLDENRYGKSHVRLLKVDRSRERHQVFEWDIRIWLKGDFSSCYEDGDNSCILPTDTMKNTVYFLARNSTTVTIEDFARELTGYLVATEPQVNEAGAEIEARNWRQIVGAEGQYPSAFIQHWPAIDTATVTCSRENPPSIVSGVKKMTILKASRSSFAGYRRNQLTTLRETTDRLLATEAVAQWTYQEAEPLDYLEKRFEVTGRLLDCFASHDSASVQHTLFAMGKAVLEAVPEVASIFLSIPNRHCNLVDLSPFGEDNPNCIFVPTDEPAGFIEASLRRSS